MTDRQRNVFILLLVLVLIGGSILAIAVNKTFLGLDLKGGVQLVYQGQPTAQTRTVTQAALQRAVDTMNQRVNQLGVSEPEISTQGTDQISVGLPDVQNTARAEKLVGTTDRLQFYDWERNAITPNGKSVASQLATQDPTALSISQGGGSLGPGSSGAGSLPLYTAVKLAAKQPREPTSNSLARLGPEYFAFGAPKSTACARAARRYHTTEVIGQYCYLAGPEDNVQDLAADLPTNVSLGMSGVQTVTVPQGWVVLQAVPSGGFNHELAWSSPLGQYFVLRDNVALFGNDITNPQQSTDPGGQPDVQFGFTGKGGNAFQTVTAQIARRGDLVSGLGQTLDQHFAVALGTQLITVPSIDFKTYPDGISGGNGADITGGFTISSAQNLAQQLRLGALPIKLKLISVSQVSATLGKQALHKGELAGLIGLLAVVIFLIAYYRVLGVIATAGLLVYALYFFALIKLIPVVLTLPGIAGLILTIGVAADANVVIFERVKEEIRAGRSIRQGILTGYRKGLSAIIDANVVTIMTAFILFVLATSDVKGFALTLGIGTAVSLFTAVMLTQAILSTMGSSRAISHPSALGAGGKKHVWRYDFMGASRYFFTLSGVILLIGALAVAGRGLNLGIDFTSGTRVTVALERSATQPQVSSVVTSVGASGATVQRVTNRGLGANVFQISSKKLQPAGLNRVEDALRARYGITANGWNPQSVGPTFGKTVTDSAILAIIASLVVISAYVALRFEWKFAVPVLIALMHDLLITSGVYALTGREVTTATVAALLTILGYSLYDTIIVFDRVRENIPRMPRAAFSQIVNRSMSEVLTRSLATTFCTLMPIVALLAFGGVAGSSELQDFAFALLIGVASGAYSSIFIASPVLTHWKEREPQYRARRRRLESELGHVPAYAEAAADVEPTVRRRRAGRLTEPEPDNVSSAEFEEMKRDIQDEPAPVGRGASTLTRRLSQGRERPAPATAPQPKPRPKAPPARAAKPDGQALPADAQAPPNGGQAPSDGDHAHAPDVAENEGVAPTPKPKRATKSRSRNRHGRRR
ncbi:MAG TPA: protein translocase subunit SecD [Solirubrobacteraceae bacterium]|nr:protein translocase subunit SecD [Solirubrobacteraceae bacterium]